MTIKVYSKDRHNGGIAVKRAHGSSTITEWFVEVDGEMQVWTVTTRGPNAQVRKMRARQAAELRIQEGV